MKRAYLILALMVPLARAQSLPEILTRMDQAAKTFRSLAADVRTTEYSSLFGETKTENATFKMRKHLKTGVVLLAEFTGADARKLRLAGKQLEIYHPKANSVEVYDTSKFTKSFDLFLLVGFGTTKAELTDTYNISLGGTETVNGMKTTRLDLTPKKEQAKKLFDMIQIWIPEGQANPIQEKVLKEQSKDYNLFLFSNLKIRNASDAPLPDSDFELNLPPGVKSIPVK